MIAASQGDRPPELLSTHPAEANRVQKIESLLPTVIPLYEAAHKHNS
jgi:predicted Zn-dependent protease